MTLCHLVLCYIKEDEVGGTLAHIEEGRGVYRIWLGGPKGRDHQEDLGIGGRITFRWTSGR